jgi:hypothetical protein
MQENELIVNGVSLDLKPNTVIGLTIQANDLGELQNRQGNFSNTFKLPFTEKNRQFFENAENINSATNVPYKRFVANYFERGLPIVQDGILTLIEVDNGYSARLNSGNTDLFNAIGDKTVGDLFGDEFHVLNMDTIIDSLDGSQNYIYPLVDFSEEGVLVQEYPNYGMDVRWLRPCVNVKKVIDLIALETGFDILGTFVDSDICNRLILTPDNCVYTKEKQEFLQANINFFSDREISGYEVVGNVAEAPTGDSFTYNLDVDSSPNTEYTVTIDSVITPVAGNGDLVLNYDFTAFIKMTDDPIIHYDRQKGIKVQIHKVGTGVIAEEILISESVYALEWFYDAVGVLTWNYDVGFGDEFFARIVFEIQEADNTGFDYGFNDAGTFELTFKPNVNINFGSIIFMKSLFTIKQKDFLMDLMKMFCILPQTNTFTKVTTLNFLDDLIENIPIAKDWSKKVDTNQLNVSFQFSKYGKKSLFKFKEPTNNQERQNTGWLNVNDENLDLETTIVQNVTTTSTESNNGIIWLVPAIETIPMTLAWKNPNNRFLISYDYPISFDDFYPTLFHTFNDQNGDVRWVDVPKMAGTYKGIEGEEYYSLYWMSFLDIDGLIEKYYKAINRILDKCKSVDLILNLNANDVRDFDFTIPIYLNVQHKKVHVNAYFYVNQISSYKGGLTKISLLRL